MPRLPVLLFTLVTTITLSLSSAADIGVGAPLPALAIEDRGELLLQGDDFSYIPWTAPGGLGKVHVLQYMAGRQSARSQTEPFTDRLKEALPPGSYHVTTVINLDDAMWGTSGFVESSVKSSKREYPDSTIVLDADGSGLKTWALQPGGATIVVLDPGGSVLYLKEGAMSPEDIDSTLELMRQHIAVKGS